MCIAAPRTKAIVSANWSADRWSALARVTRYDSPGHVFDFGGANVLDRYPDRSSDDINYAGNFPYDVLSPIGFNGAFFYARSRSTFQRTRPQRRLSHALGNCN